MAKGFNYEIYTTFVFGAVISMLHPYAWLKWWRRNQMYGKESHLFDATVTVKIKMGVSSQK